MAQCADQTAPAVIWIVGTINRPSVCMLNFPAPDDTDWPNISFWALDENEPYLEAFDEAGVRVWLQVEPGDADVSTLIDLVLGRYAHHPSVVGFGVDVEWYQISRCPDGCPITDRLAQAWSEQVRSYNPDYRLFLKHWLPERMPPTYREGITFIDDSQQFPSFEALVDEFAVWGEHFAPAPVGFQFGYPADRSWWAQLEDPPCAIGRALIERVPNLSDLYWVDFTMEELFPRQEGE